MAYNDNVRVILAEELNPYYVDNNILVQSNGTDAVFAYATPYDGGFAFNDGDTISAVCNADVSPTGGANPFKVLQVLEYKDGFGRYDGKLIWIYQDTSPGNSFTFPGLVARDGYQYTFLASSTSNGNNWYFMNVFNENFFGGENNCTIDEIYIDGYNTVYPNLAPGNAMAFPNPNGSIIPAGTTVNVHLSSPDPTFIANLYLILLYQVDGTYGTDCPVYNTGWQSLVLNTDLDTSLGGFNIELISLR